MSSQSPDRVATLLQILADGKFHSGASIAETLQVSRTAVWKLVQKIISWQVQVFSVRGKGYQIPGGLDLLQADWLLNQLQQAGCRFNRVVVLSTVDSTANYIARDWQQSPGNTTLCIAEHQSAGRGRKGRPWVSPFGANLYFSLGIAVPLGLSALGGISLAVGISLANTLNRFAGNCIKIKWPNDLLVDNRKLAGILVEASGDSNDNSFLNIGVGLNWNMQPTQAKPIDQPWVNLKALLSKKYSRNAILAQLLIDLDNTLFDYQRVGFKHFVNQWSSVSAMFRQPVTVHRPQDSIQGVEIGIEDNGALRLQTAQGVQVFHSGEVSLRRQT